MGYIFLSLALLAGTTKGYCGKKTGDLVSGKSALLLVNSLRMCFCILLSLLFVILNQEISQLTLNPLLLLLSFVSGITTAIFVVSWLAAVQKSAYMALDIFLMTGVLIPTFSGSVLFGERIVLIQFLGVILLIIAVIIMCRYNNKVKEKFSAASYIILIICGVSNGLTDLSQKLFVKLLPSSSISVFNFYTYVFATLGLLTAYLFSNKNNVKKNDNSILDKRIIKYLIIMSLCLFLNSFFKTLAASHLDSIIMYPLNQGVSLILSVIMSSLLLKEKPTLGSIAGIIIAFFGMLTIIYLPFIFN